MNLRRGALGLVTRVSLQRNEVLVLPAVSITLRRLPVPIGPAAFHLTATVDAWLQPQNSQWATRAITPGAALEVMVTSPPLGPVEVFLAGRVKSAGWRPLDPDLGAGVSGRVGVQFALGLPSPAFVQPHDH